MQLQKSSSLFFFSNHTFVKIAFDAKRLFLNRTGLGNYSRTLVRNMQKNFPEHEYILCTPRVIENKDTAHFIGNKDFTILKYPSYFTVYWRSYGIVSKLHKLGVDIYHGLSHEIPFGLEKIHIRSCVTVHDLIFEKHPEYYPVADRLFYKLKYRNSAYAADRLVAISNHTREDIVSIWGITARDVEVVYQSCNDIFFDTPHGVNERKYLLYVGSLSERKGLMDLVAAYKIMDRKYRIPVWLVGEGSEFERRLKKTIEKAGLGDYFLFIGKIDNSSLIEYYDNARALIYPSHYEGFGIPLIEASLRKVPVLCSNVSSMPEAAGPDALYFQPRNPKSIADTITYCIENEQEVARKAEKTYIYTRKRYDPYHTAHSLMKIYQELV